MLLTLISTPTSIDFMNKPIKTKAHKESRSLHGDPLNMATKPSVPKSLPAIREADAGGQLCGQERKMLNLLLSIAYPTLLTARSHTVTTAAIRDYLGTHESNDRIRLLFHRLGKLIPKIDFIDDKGEEREIFGGLLFGSLPKGEGIIRYAFNPFVIPILHRPAVFARIKLAILGQFKNKYTPMIYENLELYSNRDHPVWNIAVDDFRSILGVADKMPNFSDFRRFVLTPSLQEINEKADFTVTLEEVNNKRRGRTVERLIFTVKIKPERAIEDSKFRAAVAMLEHKNSTAVVDDTPDTPSKRTPSVISQKTFDEARSKVFPGWRKLPDLYALEKEWQEYEARQPEPARHPDQAFLGWLKKWREHHAKDYPD